MKKLSEKQQQIYDFILSFTDRTGYPPSVREIGEAVGLKSPSTVHFHLKGMREAGYLSQPEGKTRAITIMAHDGRRSRPNQVPVLGNVAAGAPILAEEHVEDFLLFDTGGRSGEHFALLVRGESMKDAGILPGDMVIVHRQQTARNGEIVVALFEDEATVKTLSTRNGETWLLPENDEYEPIDGTFAEIIGKVVAVVRHYA